MLNVIKTTSELERAAVSGKLDNCPIDRVIDRAVELARQELGAETMMDFEAGEKMGASVMALTVEQTVKEDLAIPCSKCHTDPARIDELCKSYAQSLRSRSQL